MMSREEREKRVLELHYNQDKRIRDIAKELHLSFSTINDIIKRDRQQKEKEQEKLQQTAESNSNNINNINNSNGNGEVEQNHQQAPSLLSLSLSSAAALEELSDRQKDLPLCLLPISPFAYNCFITS